MVIFYLGQRDGIVTKYFQKLSLFLVYILRIDGKENIHSMGINTLFLSSPSPSSLRFFYDRGIDGLWVLLLFSFIRSFCSFIILNVQIYDTYKSLYITKKGLPDAEEEQDSSSGLDCASSTR